jgi:hypothetical protein
MRYALWQVAFTSLSMVSAQVQMHAESNPVQVIRAVQEPTTKGGHGPDTKVGPPPHGSSNAGEIAGAAAGAAVATVVIAEIFAHRPPSPEKLGREGPKLANSLDMSAFTVTGLARGNWPVAVDFLLSEPGTVEVDVVIPHQPSFHASLTNTVNTRGIAIFRLPQNFTDGPKTAVWQFHFASARGVNPAPGLRVYGIAVGDHAVGSVAIDQLTFLPAEVHPKVKEVATYGFHAHSAFDGADADFVFTAMQNGHVLAQKDKEQTLNSISAGAQDSRTWSANGKPGQHMLEVRAWRGLPNGGDWVVAWSPDIVDVVK